MKKNSKLFEKFLVACICKFYSNYDVLDLETNNLIIQNWSNSFSKLKRNDPLWHTFSFNEHNSFLTGDEAVSAFDKIRKDNIYAFSSEHIKPFYFFDIKELSYNYSDIQNCREFFKFKHDIFFIDQSFKWTFVITHEKEFGPYFTFEN